MDPKLTQISEQTIKYALEQGADQAAISISRARFIDLKQREGEVETLQSSTSRGLSLALYVEGRYSSNSTSLLDPEAVREFVDRCLSVTRQLVIDPFRSLPDSDLYGPTEGVELDLVDQSYDALDMHGRQALVAEAESKALAAGEPVISVTAEMVTQESESLQIHSNGFRGERRSTRFILGAQVTTRDEGDRRPEDGWWTIARHRADLPSAASVGAEAARRALARIGSRKVESKKMTLLVENCCASRMVSSLLGPLTGSALQQRRSCFEGQIGEQIASPLLTLLDDPLRPRGLGSRTFDGDGLAATRLPIITAGRLSNYLIDVYYGRKLEQSPTTGSTSNLILELGDKTLDELITNIEQGILVTSFLGGNSNTATGDFSFGVTGFYIQGGKIIHPISEMNITGSHTSLWKSLKAVGNDPYPYSSMAMPSLQFEGVQFSGS